METLYTSHQLEIPWVLSDGTRVLLRPLAPTDRNRLKRGFALMSNESIYFRFLTPMSKLSSAYLKFLTNIDQKNHIAWCAIDPANPDFPGFGVGRFIRLADIPEVAEFAITVIDACQKKGLGTVLLAVLYLIAERSDVRALRAMSSPENHAVVKLLSNFNLEASFANGMLQLDFPVYSDRELLPQTCFGRKFRKLLDQLEEA